MFGVLLFGALRRHRHLPPAAQRFHQKEQVSGAFAFVLAVNPLGHRLSRPAAWDLHRHAASQVSHRNRRLDELDRTLAHRRLTPPPSLPQTPRPLWAGTSDPVARATVSFFLSKRWIVSREIVSTKPNSTALSESLRTEKSIMPVGCGATGDSDQMGRLSPRESGSRGAAGLYRARPPPVRLARSVAARSSRSPDTHPTPTRVAAVLHPSAELSRMRARVTVRALALPRWTMASKAACSAPGQTHRGWESHSKPSVSSKRAIRKLGHCMHLAHEPHPRHASFSMFALLWIRLVVGDPPSCLCGDAIEVF